MIVVRWSEAGNECITTGMHNPHTGKTRPLNEWDVEDLRRRFNENTKPRPGVMAQVFIVDEVTV